MKHRHCIASLILVLLFTISLSAHSQSKDYTVISFVQNDSSKTVNKATDSVLLAREPFSVVYYGKRYDSQKEKYHALHVAVLKDAADTLMLALGKNIKDVPYFEPGTGMAPGANGLYDNIVIANDAHHYLYYENEAERRVSRISVAYDLLELEWRISGVWSDDQEITFQQLKFPALYFVFFADRNLNEIIDANELKIIKVVFR